MNTYTSEQLAEIIANHEKWALCDGGERAKLSSADLRSAKLSFAKLSFADFSFADFSFADLSSAKLSSADLRSADLSSAKLSSADLRSAKLSFAKLSSADFSFADLSSADLRSADLRSAKLSFADLSSADLSFANLSSADLRSARRFGKTLLHFAKWDNLYKYTVEIATCTDGSVIVKMGCKELTLPEWEANWFNNDGEFPNDGSAKTKHRIAAYQFAVGYARIEGWIDADGKAVMG